MLFEKRTAIRETRKFHIILRNNEGIVPYEITPQSFSQKMTAPLSGEPRYTQYLKINYFNFSVRQSRRNQIL